MTSSQDAERPDRDEQDGQVSETGDLSAPEPEPAGGADATDKSTGTAPERADQPDA